MKRYHLLLSATMITLATLISLSGCMQSTTPDELGSIEQPIATSGLHLWLRADAGVTASGGLVSKWLDQSGNGRHASMAVTSRQPSYVPGALNGMPVLRFNGSQSMYLDVFAQPTTFTVFIVGKNTSTDSFSMILGPGGNSPNNQLRWEGGSNALFVGTGNNMPIITPPIGNNHVYHELSASYTGTTMTVYRDGNFVSSHSFSTSGPWTLASVGSWYSTYYMIGDLAEVIIYARALSSSERASVDSYLRSRYFSSCGDGVCNGSENSATCPSDCPWCGDGVCNGNESSATCPDDCGTWCGDGICTGGESSATCPSDCGAQCLIFPCQIE